MAHTKHVLKLSTIANFFTDARERRLLSRGENAVASNHVKSFHFVPEMRLLTGEIHASMRDRLYKVEVNFFTDGEIKDVSCTCPRGQFLCHHVAALLLYAHHNISVTDVECRWAMKKLSEDPVKTIEDIYVGKSHVSTPRKLNEEEIKKFLSSLQQFGTAVGFTWLLRPEPTFDGHHIVDIEDVIFSEDYFTADNKLEYFRNKLMVSGETILKVASSTVGQAKNENWLLSRKNRLTASNFGIVLAAIRRNKYPQSLFKRLTGLYNLEKVKAIQWGLIHEGAAIQEFTQETALEVQLTGLWLDNCGFLGASPDGLVGDNAIIEVKCPFKFREKQISHELETDRSYVVYFEGGEMMLNKEHEYYHQIQGNLAIVGRDVCHLFIWTPQENLVIDINRDPSWTPNLDLLKTFYIEHYLPHIISNAMDDV